ncbi:uncharacterized protein TNCV_285861 [Trichonephila clavipes]|nr:uncharacterized protein TNCV_285861 [Trichonephila clavipes]
MNATEQINDGASTSAVVAVEIIQMDDEIASTLTPDCVGIDCVRWSFLKTHWVAASARFTTTFVNNPFGHKWGCVWSSMVPALIEAKKRKTFDAA